MDISDRIMKIINLYWLSFYVIFLGMLCGCATQKQQFINPSMQSTNNRSRNLHAQEIGVGEPILLVHGFGVDSHTWDYIKSDLAKTHRVISVDLKGFGASPKPKDNQYSLLNQRDILIDFIRENKLQNITLIGHSMGGGIALLAVLELLESNSDIKIKKLVLMDAIAYPQREPRFIRILRMPIIGFLAVHALPSSWQVKQVMKEAFYDEEKIPLHLVDAYARNLKQPGSKAALLQVAKQIIPDDVNHFSTRYGAIKTSTLIIWGENDRIVPIAVGNQLNHALTNSKLVTITKCGHAPQEEKPLETLRIIIENLER